MQIISQIITLLHVSALLCHPQGACNQYLAKLHKYCEIIVHLLVIVQNNKRRTVQVKCSRYRPGVAQTVCRGIAILFHDRGTRRG